MNISAFIKKILFLKLPILKYRFLSNCPNIQGNAKLVSPVLFIGTGKIQIHKKVQIGFDPSPYLYSNYSHIESRNDNAIISIGKNTFINNKATIVSEDNKILIGENVMIGTNCNIYNSDFHSINLKERTSNKHTSTEVIIEDNVFIGNNVTILKGGSIGKNSVVAAGSIVTKKFPSNVVIAGVPAKIIKKIND
jgi:maltose O-acetyltransferase